MLICDANILIDLEIAGLAERTLGLFSCAVPDLLFYQELAERHGYLLHSGLELKELDPLQIARLMELVRKYPRPGRIDLATLVLAEAQGCPLLTGDASLRAAAAIENVEVHGTLWLVEQLVTRGGLSVTGAIAAYAELRSAGRRLPWAKVEAQLSQFAAAIEGGVSPGASRSDRRDRGAGGSG